MADLDTLNDRLQALQERQDGIDNSTPTITPGNGVYSITEAVTAATEAASLADTSKDLAESAASSAAGYAGVAKTARDAATDSASAAADYATRADSSKSAAANSATSAATAATNARTYSLNAAAYADTAQDAKTKALEAYSGAIDAYSGAVEIYAEVATLRDNIIDGLNKLDNAVYSAYEIATTGAADAATLDWINPAHHAIYYSATVAVKQLNITYDTSYMQASIANPQYVTELHYIASANAPQATYPADVIYWSGNDCATGIFTPTSQSVYDIVISSNLQRLRGYVSGTPSMTAVATLSLDWEEPQEEQTTWVRYINSTTVQTVGRYVIIDGMVYTPPTDEQCAAAGYKPLVKDAYPEEMEGFYIKGVYEDTENAVLQHWDYVAIEEPVIE